MSSRSQAMAETLARIIRSCTFPVLVLIAVICLAQCAGNPAPAFPIVQE